MTAYMPDMEFQSSQASGPQGPNAIVFEAIVRQRCLIATYNRAEVTLAPHVVFARHGDLFIDAVTIERDGRPPREEKVGTFKVAGLGDLRLAERSFEPSMLFDRADEKYAQALLTVEPTVDA